MKATSAGGEASADLRDCDAHAMPSPLRQPAPMLYKKITDVIRTPGFRE